jgi:hypothetical protein
VKTLKPMVIESTSANINNLTYRKGLQAKDIKVFRAAKRYFSGGFFSRSCSAYVFLATSIAMALMGYKSVYVKKITKTTIQFSKLVNRVDIETEFLLLRRILRNFREETIMPTEAGEDYMGGRAFSFLDAHSNVKRPSVESIITVASPSLNKSYYRGGGADAYGILRGNGLNIFYISLHEDLFPKLLEIAQEALKVEAFRDAITKTMKQEGHEVLT